MPDIPQEDLDTQESQSLAEAAPDYVAKTSKQTITLRWWVIGGAAVVIFAFAVMEIYLLHHLFESTSSNENVVLLAISPVVGITVIVVSILVGVFRGNKEPLMSRFPSETVINAVSGGEP